MTLDKALSSLWTMAVESTVRATHNFSESTLAVFARVLLQAVVICSVLVWMLSPGRLLAASEESNRFQVPMESVLSENERPYLIFGKPVERGSGAWRDDYGRSILRYDSAKDCVAQLDEGSATLDLTNIKWRNIKGKNAFDVCAFRVIVLLSSIDDVAAWMKSQGFEVLVINRQGEQDVEVGEDDIQWLIGKWTLEQFRSKTPSILSRIGVDLIQSVNLSVSYDENGEIIEINFSENTK